MHVTGVRIRNSCGLSVSVGNDLAKLGYMTPDFVTGTWFQPQRSYSGMNGELKLYMTSSNVIGINGLRWSSGILHNTIDQNVPEIVYVFERGKGDPYFLGPLETAYSDYWGSNVSCPCPEDGNRHSLRKCFLMLFSIRLLHDGQSKNLLMLPYSGIALKKPRWGHSVIWPRLEVISFQKDATVANRVLESSYEGKQRHDLK